MTQALINKCYHLSQLSWQRHYNDRNRIERYPSESIVRLVAPFFDKGLKLLDIGGGSGKIAYLLLIVLSLLRILTPV